MLLLIGRRKRYIVPTTHIRLDKNQLVQCFLVSGTALSLIYAGVAVLSEDYSGLILPAVVACYVSSFSPGKAMYRDKF